MSPLHRRLRRWSCVGVATVLVLLQTGFATKTEAQFKKRAAQVILCGGGAYAGFKLGDKLAQGQIKRAGLVGAEAQKVTRAFQIGTAVVLCGGGALLAGTIYDGLSKRDLQARQREMDAALADAEPTPRSYVLPDSKYEGTITAEPAVVDGDKECRVVVDHLADAEGGEPVMTKFCRKPPNGKYELEAF